MTTFAKGLSALLLLAGLVMGTVFYQTPGQTTAQPAPQTFPTATLLPVDDLEYTIEQITASDEPLTFDDQTVDGFSFTDITYQTRYPRGLEFTLTVLPPEGQTLTSVTLFYEFAGGARGRAEGELLDPDTNQWRAIPFDRGGLPPWQVMDITFRAITVEENSADTEPITVQYTDPTRPWWYGESEHVIIYWFDFPPELGEVVLKAVASVQDKYEKGFGGLLSYKPRVTIWPPGDAIGEYRTGGVNNPRTTGSADSRTQSAVLRIRGLEIEDIRQDCIWNEPRDLQWQMDFAASVTTHEIAHLYQFEFFSARGPAWWIEGQATFFETDSGVFDERLRNLALFQDLPTLQGSGPSGMVGTPAADGCTHLGYEMGASFINWFVNAHSGYEGHQQLVELMSRNVGLAEALEQVSGTSFIELEKQWRAYLGLNPEPRIVPTPTFPSIPTQAPFTTPPGGQSDGD